MKLNVLGEESKRLRLVLEDLKDTLTTGNDDNVKVLKLVVGVLGLMSASVPRHRTCRLTS